MASFGVTISKDIEWRGGTERISNVYHYHTSEGQVFPDLAVIQELVRLEKLVFANTVKFVVARTWGPTDQGPVDSVTREVVDLAGSGSAVPLNSMYRESAILISWPLGRYGVRNRAQFLRKFLHTASAHGYDPSGAIPIASQPAAGTPLATYMEGVRVLNPAGFVGGLDLCTAGDRVNTGAGRIYPYLEHRQFNQ